ncbi:hypothetical protein [Nocardioides sp.]|uniref:hypothetical protein n=1 Tax=Nocardioides sp. TaxID=35761 RepID=UPI0039E6F738
MTGAPGSGADGPAPDLFDDWLAHRDGPEPAEVSSVVPPRWAPKVSAPSHVEAPLEEVSATEEVPPAEEPSPAPTALAPTAEAPTAEAPAAEAPATVGPVSHGEPPYPLKVVFKPRTRMRAAIGVVAALAVVCAAGASLLAWHDRSETTLGIALTMWLLAGIIWAVHSGTSVTRMTVRGGQLDVLWHGTKLTFDLTSSYTPVEVHGRPGRSSWKVVFRRGGMSPFVIDGTMVDPHEFMEVLRYYRPSIDAA